MKINIQKLRWVLSQMDKDDLYYVLHAYEKLVEVSNQGNHKVLLALENFVEADEVINTILNASKDTNIEFQYEEET